MDKLIPPEMAVPVSSAASSAEASQRSATAELQLRDAIQIEAFDIALQRAEQRRGESVQDCYLAAQMTKLDCLNDSSVEYSLSNAEHVESGPAVFSAGSAQIDLAAAHTNKDAVSSSSMQQSTRPLSEDTLSLLLNNIHAFRFSVNESIELELADNPDGVRMIRLTPDQNTGWTVELSLDDALFGTAICQRTQSENLIEQLQGIGIRVNGVTVNHDQLPVSPEVS